MFRFVFETRQVSNEMGWVHPVNRMRENKAYVAKNEKLAWEMAILDMKMERIRRPTMGQWRPEYIKWTEAA